MSEQKVGLYLRLSRDDERAGESMSIENQRSYLMQYVQKRNWSVAELYTDDGYSGTHFDRPSFKRLLNDIDAGRINVVITKDLSRLGRDQIGTAYFYQVYFPQKHVRYIAVTEGFDTMEPGSSNVLFPFLTAANDFYTADISRKVRTALLTRKREGKFIGSSPPLGYRKDPNVHGHLLIDSQGAEIIRQIFQLYLLVGSVVGVAKELTEQHVPTPSQYKSGKGLQKRFYGVWNDTMVRRILTNPTYAGHLTQNRREKVNYKISQRVDLPRDSWIIVPNTHEPLISQADFDRVQEMLTVRSYSCARNGKSHLLTGLAFCADCGSPMTYVKESKSRIYMVCQGYRKGGRLHLCTSHCIREDVVIGAVLEQFRSLSRHLDIGEFQRAIQSSQGNSQRQDRQASTAKQKLQQLNVMLEQLYQDRAAGVLLEQEFHTLLARNRDERAQWEILYKQAQTISKQENIQQDYTEEIRQFLAFKAVDRTTVLSLLERVLIHEDKTVELIFRVCDPN